tara:strand:+ start:815 stop:994 length:180 start_codon:yes stop_codon:yes gene_type:complete
VALVLPISGCKAAATAAAKAAAKEAAKEAAKHAGKGTRRVLPYSDDAARHFGEQDQNRK